MSARSKFEYNPFSTWTFWATSSVAGAFVLTRYEIVPPWFKTTASLLFLAQWFTYLTYTIVIYPRFVSPLRHLPEPDGNAFFSGQWSKIVKEPSGIPLRRWTNEIPNNGLIRYRHLFNRDRVLVVSPKGLAEVMVTKSYDFVKPDFIAAGIGRILGMGILFAEGDEHKKQRKALGPAFNFRHIKQLYPIFWTKSVEMVDAIISQSIGEWASRATLDIIGVAGLGQDFDSIAKPDTELNRVYRAIFQPSRTGQILALLQFFIPSFIIQNLPIKRNEDVMAASKVARDTSQRLIDQKRRAIAAKQELSPDITSIALESGGFSDEDLVNNMMTFLAAGHETTASAMTWALYSMCQHPETQKRLREEVRQHIPDPHSTAITSEIIDNMPYLHAMCNETLRMWSPVPLTLRDAAVNTTILGQFIPKGTKVILCPWAVNFSKELWGPDAEVFNPERWLAPGQANAGGAQSNYSFLTFLHGPRSCIGEKFARAELAALLAAFVGKFEVEFRDKADGEHILIKGGITARPRDGLWLKIREVPGW
ncbi:Cytochrome 4d1 [Cyphellophora attinorum]|uniref:Cytochrome 4d1 n=1 Tax=Cyphellophora attinorum TaxID=1664694 RepID=A0A0N0NSC8_9EURO|nr:Cytochrome 4d1 [Phialophora attinorum]KPI45859.1 Cytochrome 4d1 [Phialophora attinorum]